MKNPFRYDHFLPDSSENRKKAQHPPQKNSSPHTQSPPKSSTSKINHRHHSTQACCHAPSLPRDHKLHLQQWQQLGGVLSQHHSCLNHEESHKKTPQQSSQKISKCKIAETKENLAPKPLLLENLHHFVLFHIQHNEIRRMYTKAEALF